MCGLGLAAAILKVLIFHLCTCVLKQVLCDDGNKHISSRDKPGAWHSQHQSMGYTHTYAYLLDSLGSVGSGTGPGSGESCRRPRGRDNSWYRKHKERRGMGQCQHPGWGVLTLCPRAHPLVSAQILPGLSTGQGIMWGLKRLVSKLLQKGKRPHGNCSKSISGSY